MEGTHATSPPWETKETPIGKSFLVSSSNNHLGKIVVFAGYTKTGWIKLCFGKSPYQTYSNFMFDSLVEVQQPKMVGRKEVLSWWNKCWIWHWMNKWNVMKNSYECLKPRLGICKLKWERFGETYIKTSCTRRGVRDFQTDNRGCYLVLQGNLLFLSLCRSLPLSKYPLVSNAKTCSK